MSRRFPGQRGIRILVRTAHIGAVVTFMGGILFGSSSGAGGMVLGLTGIYLMVDQLVRDGIDHFRFVTFWAVVLKVAALVLGMVFSEWLVHSLWFCLVVGGLVSHAPGSVRHFSLWGVKGPCALRRGTSSVEPAPTARRRPGSLSGSPSTTGYEHGHGGCIER